MTQATESPGLAGTAATWHALDPAEVAAVLDTDAELGLTPAVAAVRLQEVGPNRLAETDGLTWPVVLARQFRDVLTLILIIAAIMSVVVGEVIDAGTILAIVVLNGILGFVQEWKAERALAALREMLSPHCTVIRAGSEQILETSQLVPGDLVQLETGSRVPADLRVVRTAHLRVDESALTGESLSVEKSTAAVPAAAELAARSSMAWMGTIVTAGRALGLVVATGSQTQFGRISALTESVTAEPTPLQRKMAVLGRQLGAAAVVISVVVALSGWWLGKPWAEMFLTGVSLAVAVVPEGLPAVVTLTMALGVRAMVRRRALLRRLQAAESLGAATVVCTDKTGTLTQNQMTVNTIWLPTGQVDVTGVGYDPAGHFEQAGQRIDYRQRPDLLRLLRTGLHCNHARLRQTATGWEQIGEPTEGALVVAGYKAWLDLPSEQDTLVEFEFDSTRKRMTVVKGEAGERVAHMKGAPEVILQRCTHIQTGDDVKPLDEAARCQVQDALHDLAADGLRTLALARRTLPPDTPLNADAVEQRLTLLGLTGMLDPPRPEVPHAVEMARQAGIQIVMITGDAAETASAVGRLVGLQFQRTLSGSDLDGMTDGELDEALAGDVIFARSNPEHKIRIVTALQQQGHIVGMTGDGVNDAPALKKADIGIAMGLRGTDVAKGAADMVLTDDNFSSIIGAIEEGRRQYDNIQKFVRYLLSSNTGEVLAIFLSILCRGPLILLPVQILWMNLVTDGLSAVALGVEPAESSVMRRPPRDTKARVIDRAGLLIILVLGGYVGLATLALFQLYLRSGDPVRVGLAQTVAFTGIIVIQKMNVLNFRSLTAPLTWHRFWTNPWVLVAILFSLGLQVAAVYVPLLQDTLHTVPLGWRDWLLVWAVALPIFVGTELFKRVWLVAR